MTMAPSTTNLTQQMATRNALTGRSQQSPECHSESSASEDQPVQANNAWQHANSLLLRQQRQSTLKSSEQIEEEEDEQEDSRQRARVGNNSCWGTFQNLFTWQKYPQVGHEEQTKSQSMKFLEGQLSKNLDTADSDSNPSRTSLSGTL